MLPSTKETLLEEGITSMVNPTQVSLPNVFVTPPEEEFDMPPWCCFDANKDALPGALPDEDIIAADFDYTAHGDADDDDIVEFGRMGHGDELMDMDAAEEHISVLMHITERGASQSPPPLTRRDNVFAMHSLVAEAETIRERLRSLDLSVNSRSKAESRGDVPVDAVQDEDDAMNAVAPAVPLAAEQPQSTKKFFSFKPILRKKSRKELPSYAQASATVPGAVFPSGSQPASAASMEEKEEEFSILERPTSPGSMLPDAGNIGRKPGFFARLRKISTSKKSIDTERPMAQLKSADALRSCETLTSPRTTQDTEPAVRRRFSFFELPRRLSTSSQSTIPSTPIVPDIELELSDSTSSVATSSVPPTPEAVNTDLSISPPGDPIVDLRKIISLDDEPSGLLPQVADSVENLAASLSVPSYSTALPTSFTLDPLHFESLEFTSDDFP